MLPRFTAGGDDDYRNIIIQRGVGRDLPTLGSISLGWPARPIPLLPGYTLHCIRPPPGMVTAARSRAAVEEPGPGLRKAFLTRAGGYQECTCALLFPYLRSM